MGKGNSDKRRENLRSELFCKIQSVWLGSESR